MPMPTINLQNGGSVKAGESFAWVTTSTGSIEVVAQIMPNGDRWFTPSPCNFTGPTIGPLPDNSNVVTATTGLSPVGGWGYTSNVPSGDGHVIVTSSMEEQRKAS
jgi:hypothetical protein